MIQTSHSTPEVKYPNDPTDPTKPGQPVVPDVPGYEPHLPDPKDPTKPGKSVPPGTPITPEKPGEDTPIIYVPKTTEVTKPTKQTVTFEGAGTATPADKVKITSHSLVNKKMVRQHGINLITLMAKKQFQLLNITMPIRRKLDLRQLLQINQKLRIRLLINHLVRSFQLIQKETKFQVHQLHSTTMIHKIQLRVAKLQLQSSQVM